MDGYQALPSKLPSSGTHREDDIELANLIQEPGSSHSQQNSGRQSDSDDEDHDIGDEDQSDHALLGSRERTRGRERQPEIASKPWPQIRMIVLETGPTLLFNVVSMLFTGKLLERVSHWRAMKQVDELIIIIPVILNLKGNLEMNLSARLGTAANVGELDKAEVQRSVVYGNLLLLQVQATVVSFVATIVAFVIGLVVPDPVQSTTAGSGNPAERALHHLNTQSRRRPPFIPIKNKDSIQRSGFREFMMVASTSMTAACLSSLFLGSLMCLIVLICRRYGRDPDNIAPPIASCLGDLITLSFIGLVSTLLIPMINTPIPSVVGLVVILSAITCATFTRRNPLVRHLLLEGWSPLFGAMVIEVATGIVLDLFVHKYEGFAILAVAISSLPGNVGSILVSRLSTALHAAALSISQSRNSRQPSPKLVMITLLLVTLPVEIIFLVVVHAVGWLNLPFLFMAWATLFFCCTVGSSLLIARALTNFLWSKGFDPDIYALPVHSAVMDLIGQSLLVLCFEIVAALGAHVRSKPGS